MAALPSFTEPSLKRLAEKGISCIVNYMGERDFKIETASQRLLVLDSKLHTTIYSGCLIWIATTLLFQRVVKK